MRPPSVADYYARQPSPLWMPLMAQFRHYRAKLASGRWKKVPLKVYPGKPRPARNGTRSAPLDTLVRWAIQVGAIDLYYSTACWKNPERIGIRGRSGRWPVADNLLLNHDLVFDVDAKEPITLKGLEGAKQVTWNLFLAMQDYPGYVLQYCAFTGQKGFRLTYTDTGLSFSDVGTIDRWTLVTERRKVFIDGLLHNLRQRRRDAQYYDVEPVFDKKVTVDCMRVIRLPGSVHSQTGLVSTMIDPWNLRGLNMSTFLTHIPIVETKRAESLLQAMTPTSPLPPQRPQSRLLSRPEDVPALASSSHYFLTSAVLGTKGRVVPILLYQKDQPYRREVRRLQARFALGPAYVFQNDTTTCVLFLKILQRRQLLKVLRRSRSLSTARFQKYKMIWMPFMSDFVTVLRGRLTGHISRAHRDYVTLYGKGVPDAPAAGTDLVKLIKAKEAP